MELDAAVCDYLATLTDASPSTQRQRAWALHELLARTGRTSVRTALHPDAVHTWLQEAATGSPTTGSPTTGSPTTGSPTTGSPTTGSPTTGSPTTGSPTTAPELDATSAPAAAPPDGAHDGAHDGAQDGGPDGGPDGGRGRAPASLPGLRARASAVRALARHAVTTGALPAADAAALEPVLRLPAPALAAGPDPDPVRRLLSLAHPDARPRAVHPAVWARFCAHTHLLALTGEREDVMATLPLTALTGPGPGPGGAVPHRPSHLEVAAGLAPRRWTLPEPARTALTGWLEQRELLVAALTGGAPSALWLRARPSSDHRTGAVRPAGLPLSDRGLRLAFTTTVAVLAHADPAVADLGTAAVRNYGRGRPSAP